MRLRLGLALALSVAPPAAAQLFEPPPSVTVEHYVDTGWVANDGQDEDVVAGFPVVYEPGQTLRLNFSEVALAPGSAVRVTSMEDGAEQLLYAPHVEAWRNSTAYFNGNGVWVELIAQPGTGPNRLVLSTVEAGLPKYPADSQCGPTDDRQPSSDPRVGRLMPVACTAWLVDDCAKCYLSAGHCAGTINSVHFNVPPSDPNGSLNAPPPKDQYPIDPASIQISTGFGTDWVYFGTFANTSTGLKAYEAQGATFELADPPPTAGNTIRITGHGTDFTPDGTFNQIQQTHVGPFTSNSGTVLQYQADTEGGNSGSPVIWEEADMAIGVHTNAGCGQFGGSNSGTSILEPGLQDALQNPLGVCELGGFGGPFENLGNGLVAEPFFPIEPILAACGTLEPDTDLIVTLETATILNADVFATMFVGFTQINAPFLGGVLVPAPDIMIPNIPIDTSQSAFGKLTFEATWPAGVPSGAQIVMQAWVTVDWILADGLLASNGLSLTAP